MMHLEIEIGPSVIMLYGTFLKRLWYIKESFLSWDQIYTEMPNDFDPIKAEMAEQSGKKQVSKPYYDIPYQLENCDKSDPRNFRPLSVKLFLAIHNINGHLLMDLEENQENIAFPIGFTDRLALELEKKYTETILQLYVDPLNIFIVDSLKRNYDKNICQGHLCLSAVQVRGHAMFSDEGRIKTDTLEYSWLLEILLGDITGSVTPVQTQQVVYALETLLTLVLENEYEFEPVYLDRKDPGLPYKYEVTRFSIDLIDLFIVELGTALNLNLQPIRLSLCNSHTQEYAKGLSACIRDLQVKLFLNEASRSEPDKLTGMSKKPAMKLGGSRASFHRSNKSLASSNQSVFLSSLNSSSISSIDSIDKSFINKSLNDNLANRLGSSGSNQKQKQFPDSDDFNYWFECLSFSTGAVNFDLALDKGKPEQQLQFLRKHDLKTKRLYFLWDELFDLNGVRNHKCGCVGGCLFYSVFDNNFDVANDTFQLGQDDYFFNLTKSISRENSNFARSLFSKDKSILNSHPVMVNKYAAEIYNYELNAVNKADLHFYAQDNTSTDSSNVSYQKFNDEKILNPPPKASILKKKSSLHSHRDISASNRTLAFAKDVSENTLKRVNSKSLKSKTKSEISLNTNTLRKKSSIRTSISHMLANSVDNVGKPLMTKRLRDSQSTLSRSSSSLFSSSADTATNVNEDDFITADEEEEGESDANESTLNSRRFEKNSMKNSKNLVKIRGRVSNSSDTSSVNRPKSTRVSAQSIKSKNSFLSIIENDDLNFGSKMSVLTNTLVDDEAVKTLTRNKSDSNSLRNVKSKYDEHLMNDTSHLNEVESEMTLKFDIQRPILGKI